MDCWGQRWVSTILPPHYHWLHRPLTAAVSFYHFTTWLWLTPQTLDSCGEFLPFYHLIMTDSTDSWQQRQVSTVLPPHYDWLHRLLTAEVSFYHFTTSLWLTPQTLDNSGKSLPFYHLIMTDSIDSWQQRQVSTVLPPHYDWLHRLLTAEVSFYHFTTSLSLTPQTLDDSGKFLPFYHLITTDSTDPWQQRWVSTILPPDYDWLHGVLTTAVSLYHFTMTLHDSGEFLPFYHLIMTDSTVPWQQRWVSTILPSDYDWLHRLLTKAVSLCHFTTWLWLTPQTVDDSSKFLPFYHLIITDSVDCWQLRWVSTILPPDYHWLHRLLTAVVSFYHFTTWLWLTPRTLDNNGKSLPFYHQIITDSIDSWQQR